VKRRGEEEMRTSFKIRDKHPTKGHLMSKTHHRLCDVIEPLIRPISRNIRTKFIMKRASSPREERAVVVDN
jgi:hypothetical protein